MREAWSRMGSKVRPGVWWFSWCQRSREAPWRAASSETVTALVVAQARGPVQRPFRAERGGFAPYVVGYKSCVDRRVRWAKSSRRHRIGHASALFVMNTTPDVRTEVSGRRPLRSWVGMGERGRELEVVAVEYDDLLLVIHIMPTDLRRR